MSIEWIPVSLRVPDDRREVLTWGAGKCLGVSAFNWGKKGGCFDIERRLLWSARVTHWAEITGPAA